MATRIRPFLKWAGSKFNCLDFILQSFPAGNRLIEPFAGSASVFLNTNYQKYIISEANQDLIALFTKLQKEGDDFIHYCESFFTPQNNDPDRYYEFRNRFNSCTDSRERSALFLYLNRHGYNGLCRYNSKGIYNVPFGRYEKVYFLKKSMEIFYKKSQQVNFIHQDFADTFKLAEKGDIIYCDPPYSPIIQESNFASYIKTKFSEKDHIKLAKLAQLAANKNVTVLISNHDTQFARELYKNSSIKTFKVARMISCNADKRQQVSELLAIFQ